MITFSVSILCLLLGYFVYGKFIARVFGIDEKKLTPARRLADGVDYQVLPAWKVFLIQLLNIAGLGPIFGAVLGAAYGPVAYIWIVVGCVFMGAVHDFFSGFVSLRRDGMSLPDVIGEYLGVNARRFFRVYSAFFLLLIGASFVNGPAGLLGNFSRSVRDALAETFPQVANCPLPGLEFWICVIFAYYIFSTIMPIGKFIARIYPVMCAALVFMAVGVAGAMIWKNCTGALAMPELTLATLKNFHSAPSENLLFPMLFVVISCGALSGFHATQSPMMARCLGNEKLARPVFYGAMISEGVIAMIWATAAMTFCGGPEGLNAAADAGSTPAIIVNEICKNWLGIAGSILAIFGVIVCPISSGDTAFRGIRLILADAFSLKQNKLLSRILISVPIFVAAFFLCRFEFAQIWKYVGIGNQTMAAATLWAGSIFMRRAGKPHWILSVPAMFITAVCVSYFLVAPYKSGGLALAPVWIGYASGALVAVAIFCAFLLKTRSRKN